MIKFFKRKAKPVEEKLDKIIGILERLEKLSEIERSTASKVPELISAMSDTSQTLIVCTKKQMELNTKTDEGNVMIRSYLMREEKRRTIDDRERKIKEDKERPTPEDRIF